MFLATSSPTASLPQPSTPLIPTSPTFIADHSDEVNRVRDFENTPEPLVDRELPFNLLTQSAGTACTLNVRGAPADFNIITHFISQTGTAPEDQRD